jgi:hypothetical protein
MDAFQGLGNPANSWRDLKSNLWTFQHKALPSRLDDQSPWHFFEWQLGLAEEFLESRVI